MPKTTVITDVRIQSLESTCNFQTGEEKDHYQSNNREYIVLANASLLAIAEAGSSVLVIISSGVTITRVISAFSKFVQSHLQETLVVSIFCGHTEHIRKLSILRKENMHSLQKFCCSIKVEPGLIILDYR